MNSLALSNRLGLLRRFYSLLGELARRSGGPHSLADCSGRMDWPGRGVYFFFEQGEERSDSGAGPRVVRVGTHGLIEGSRSTLWRRLYQHRGPESGFGNHRASVFRLLVGSAIIGSSDDIELSSWSRGSSAPAEVRDPERELERQVSSVVGRLPFLVLEVNDEPGPGSLRGVIERNSIAVLSNAGKTAIDPPSAAWLGRSCPSDSVRESGLWNQNHVHERYDPSFLDVLEEQVRRQP